MKSLMTIVFVLGFPLVNCNGVTTSMGLPISVDNIFSASSVVHFSGEDDDLSSLFFIIISFLSFPWFSNIYVSQILPFRFKTSTFSSFSRVSCLVELPASGFRVSACCVFGDFRIFPCNSLGRPLLRCFWKF
jgi:hypothetical protein